MSTPDPSGHAVRAGLVFQRAPVGIIHFDAEGVIQACNPAFAALIGAPVEAMRGFAMLERVQNQGVLRAIREVLGGQEATYEGPYVSVSSAKATIIRLQAFPLFDDDGSCMGGTIITEDRTESARVEYSYRALVEQAADAILVGDPKGNIIDANQRAADLSGFSREQLLGIHIRSLFSDASLQATPLRFDLLNQNQRVTSERLLRRYDGTELPIEMTSVKLPDGRYQAIIRDIRPRLAWEQSLREAERKYLDLFNNTPDNLFRIAIEPDGGFRVEDVNPAQERALGMTREALVGRRLEEFLAPPLLDSIAGNYRRCIASGENLTYQEVADLPQGRSWFETLLVPIRDGSGDIRHLVGFSRDITERKHTEEALLQASKLESLGVLAGGIAHDFNNLLAAILGNLNLAQEFLEGSPAWPYLETAEKTVLRASDLTRQMLAYSGKGRFVILPQDVNEIVRELTQLLQVSISKRIRLQFELAPSLPTIEADAAQVQQVIMNLVTNASDAVGDRDGVITLRTQVRGLDEHELVQCCPGQVLSPGRFVVIDVEDTGCGMTPEVQARIFDPFFTTKVTGRGLGLSALLGILRGHGAGLKITSEPGRGSLFQVLFPASTEAASAPVPVAEPEAQVYSGMALVVDDEPALCATASKALQALGFQVLTAEDGEAALVCHQRNEGAIRLVLMDLTMPRMGGLEAAEALHQVEPGLPIILSSGYSEQEALKSRLGSSLAGFLPKPYTLRELHQLVAKVMRGAR